MADISKVQPNEVIFEMLHPGTEQKIGIRIPLHSVNDDVMKKVKKKINNDLIALQKKGKSFDYDQVEANRHLVCFTAMTGWEWYRPMIEPEKTEMHTIIIPANGDEPERRDIQPVVIPAVYGEHPSFHGDEHPTFNRETVFRVFDELGWFRDAIEERISETKSFF